MNISFVTPTHDRAEQLANTLTQIRIQTRQPLEVIVVQDGFDDGSTERACKQYGFVRHIVRKNRPDTVWSNPAIPFNIGIRQAQGDIIIIQPPEVRFTKPTDLESLVAPVEADANTVAFSICEALKPDGSHMNWFTHDRISPSGLFCTAMRREKLLALGGFEESYIGYGFEDWDLCWRIQNSGSMLVWAKGVIVQHQFHRTYPGPDYSIDHKRNSEQLAKAIADHRDGLRTLEANLGREWGLLES